MARKKAGCPAITLQIKNPPSDISLDIILTLEAERWPLSTHDGFKIEQWLGTKVRKKMRCEKAPYLVAKQNKSEKVLRGTSNMDSNKL